MPQKQKLHKSITDSPDTCEVNVPHSVTTGHKKRYLHQIHSHQDVGNKVLPDAYAPKYSTETILI